MRRYRRHRGLDQGDRRTALQGRQHGRRRGDRGGDQRAGRPRISLRVRRRRRELRGVARAIAPPRRTRWPRPRPGPTRARTYAPRGPDADYADSPRKGPTCAWRATDGRTNLSYAMFAGGGLACADAAIKRGEFVLAAAPPGTWPDLTGLSCRFEQFRTVRGTDPCGPGRAGARRQPVRLSRRLPKQIVSLVEESPDAGRPVPDSRSELGWPPPGVELETHTLPPAAVAARSRAGAHVPVFPDHALGSAPRQFCRRRPTCARSRRIPISANTTTGCA